MSYNKINILTQYFYPDNASTAQLLTDIAEGLSNQNINVSVYTTFPNYNHQDKAKVEKNENYNNVKIYRVYSTRFNKNKKLGKILNSISFFFAIFFKLIFSNNKAPLLIVSNPPFLPLMGYIMKKTKKVKYIFLVHDIYPDIAVKLGYLKADSFLTNLWSKINMLIYKNADKIICLGRHMKKIVKEVYNNSRDDNIALIHNWADGKKIKPMEKKKNWFVKKYNVQDKFIVLYSGNHGLFHNLEIIIEAADILKNNKKILFLFIGDGGKKESLIKMVQERGLKNVQFLPYQSHENLPYSLSCADVSLISLEEGIEGLAVPSKLYSALAIGKPVITIMNNKSETARVVTENNCGYNVTFKDKQKLASLIIKLYKDEKLVNSIGLNSRRCFEKKFDKEIILREYFDVLKNI